MENEGKEESKKLKFQNIRFDIMFDFEKRMLNEQSEFN